MTTLTANRRGPIVMDAADTYIRDHIALIIDIIDRHDAGIYNDTYMCPCKFRGTQQEWHTHIADLITVALAKQDAA